MLFGPCRWAATTPLWSGICFALPTNGRFLSKREIYGVNETIIPLSDASTCPTLLLVGIWFYPNRLHFPGRHRGSFFSFLLAYPCLGLKPILLLAMTFFNFCAQLSIIRITFEHSRSSEPSLTETWNFLRFREQSASVRPTDSE